MTRVLLFGATGLLGGHLAAALPKHFDTFSPRPRRRGAAPADRADSTGQWQWLDSPIDVMSHDTVERAIDAARPDVIVNAIGATSTLGYPGGMRAAEDVNARFPHRLAALATSRHARVVHISTDAVYSGSKGNYAETDKPDPDDLYGMGKLAGELGPPHLTIRTSFFGRSAKRHGLIEWLLTMQGGWVEGWTDYKFSGVAAAVLSELIVTAIATPALEGIYHVGGEPVTKYEVLAAAIQQLRLDIDLRVGFGGRIDRSLDSTRFFSAIGRPRPTLVESVATLTASGGFGGSTTGRQPGAVDGATGHDNGVAIPGLDRIPG